jgi:hypothetical protein
MNWEISSCPPRSLLVEPGRLYSTTPDWPIVISSASGGSEIGGSTL